MFGHDAHASAILWLQASNSLTSGNLMANTKLPLATWLLAIHLIRQARTGLSALWRKRHLRVSHLPTRVHQKRYRAMARQDASHQFSGAVQHDDAYIAGERASGMVGSASENRISFAAAVSVNDQSIRCKSSSMYSKAEPVKRSAIGPRPIWHASPA